MRPDVLSLYRFYETPLGRAAATMLGDTIIRHAPLVTGKRVVGLGYSLPYLDKLKDLGALPVAFMPATQGVCHWPDTQRPLSALVNSYDLPLADSSVDMMLLVHSFEHAHKPHQLLREIWRVLVPGGRVIIAVPNRRRMWSALESTPFGHGKPYTKTQLYRLMEEQMLPPKGWDTALMQPPTKGRLFARTFRLAESPIRALGKNLGGALVVHADKEMYGAIPSGKRIVRTIPVTTGA